ncbi:hypothetical protein EDC94DRAFT_602245 [Helicostylum pulchrum]|nr:hypothetical protein EDC94DRAFT_602245 [Helicostylum pulchrum]
MILFCCCCTYLLLLFFLTWNSINQSTAMANNNLNLNHQSNKTINIRNKEMLTIPHHNNKPILLLMLVLIYLILILMVLNKQLTTHQTPLLSLQLLQK